MQHFDRRELHGVCLVSCSARPAVPDLRRVEVDERAFETSRRLGLGNENVAGLIEIGAP